MINWNELKLNWYFSEFSILW